MWKATTKTIFLGGKWLDRVDLSYIYDSDKFKTVRKSQI